MARNNSSVIIEDRGNPWVGISMVIGGLAVFALAVAVGIAVWQISAALSAAVWMVGGGLSLSLGGQGVAEVIRAYGDARAAIIEAQGRAQAAVERERRRALSDTPSPLPRRARPVRPIGTVTHENGTNEWKAGFWPEETHVPRVRIIE